MTFAHLTIATENVIPTSRFFQTVMGWKPLDMPGNIDVEAAWLEISPTQQLHILGVKGAKKAEDQEFGRHVAFLHPADDWQGVQHRLAECGGEIVPPIRETPFRRLFFRDPNGYLFELIDQDGFRQETS